MRTPVPTGKSLQLGRRRALKCERGIAVGERETRRRHQHEHGHNREQRHIVDQCKRSHLASHYSHMHGQTAHREHQQRRKMSRARDFDQKRPGEHLEQHRAERRHEEHHRHVVVTHQRDQHERQRPHRHGDTVQHAKVEARA